MKAKLHFEKTYYFHLQGQIVSRVRNQHESRYSAYSSTLKMESICSSEVPVEFQQTKCLYIKEDYTLHNPLL
jgi:hypothetical protein